MLDSFIRVDIMIVLTLRPDPQTALICDNCGRNEDKRVLSIMLAKVVIHLCENCGDYLKKKINLHWRD